MDEPGSYGMGIGVNILNIVLSEGKRIKKAA